MQRVKLSAVVYSQAGGRVNGVLQTNFSIRVEYIIRLKISHNNVSVEVNLVLWYRSMGVISEIICRPVRVDSDILYFINKI